MYIDLKKYLVHPVPIIDYIELKQYTKGHESFYFNGSIYFPKMTNLNELIGEELSKYMRLRTVNFDLFEKINTGEIFIASKSFINTNSTYITYRESLSINDSNNNSLRSTCIDENNYQQLLNNIFKMFAIDIYMGQKDRCYVNYQFEKYDTGYLDLAPIYDFTESAWDQDIAYTCDLYDFYFKSSYDEFFSIYPESLEMIKKIKDVDLKKIIEKMEINKGIKLTEEIIDVYLKREEITQKKLEKIIK